jgi:hypothetical protein
VNVLGANVLGAIPIKALNICNYVHYFYMAVPPK